jgi:Pyruvate/2-oxoacid:ferredoxin oxidoreductase gamma subunit
MDETNRVYVVPELAAQIQTRAQKIVFQADTSRLNRKSLAMTALAAIIRDTGFIPLDALKEAITAGQRAEIAAENLRALEASAALV